MTPARARLKILASIDAARRHAEPFRWGGVGYAARLPTRLQLQMAHAIAAKAGAVGFLASLAVQCTELQGFPGQMVFQHDDVGRLVNDEMHGFLAAFNRAVEPFLTPPVELPSPEQPEGERKQAESHG